MTPPPWLPRAKHLYTTGHSLAEVARALGLPNEQTVRQALLTAGVPTRSQATGRAWVNLRRKLANMAAGPRPSATRRWDMGKL